jgi:hypothetical protein
MDEHDQRDWLLADAAFDQLLDLAPDLRESALASMDLSPAVRARVARLLAADANAASPLDRPLTIAAATRTLEGQVIDRWRLGPEIGRGGMSVVHAAEAVDHPGRRAALKLLTAGALAGEGLDRFRREQVILSRLSHPHIAPLYDAGIAADGTPWLAMALIEGVRIDAWCRERDLGVAARVRLLLDVCDAVAHAHQALVIHRDLKPGNVLVDREGHVRLLDFGIARLGDESDGERTATTHRALTPDYAAPEQFTGAPPSTAMDIWGIGALAYQLLTGKPPRAAAAMDGSLTRPSRAVAEGHFGDSTLTQRARRIQRGDLDAIVLKALAPDPAQRYASVAVLAEDLRRWLAGQPVLAQPPTLRYRAGKFVRRHRGAVAAATIAVIGVLGGLGVSLWQAHRAELAAAEARDQATRAEAAQARAEAQLRRADSLREFLTRLFGASDPDRPAAERPTLDSLLDIGARRALDAKDIDPAVQADMLTTIGRVHLLTQDRAKALELLEAAVKRAREAGAEGSVELARALLWLGQARSDGDSTRWTDVELREAAAVLEAHAPQSPLRIEVANARAFQRMAQLDPRAALALIDPILDASWGGPAPSTDERKRLLDTAAMLRLQTGDVAGARRAFDEAILIERDAGRQSTRGFAITLANSAAAEIAVGALDQAEARAREAIAIHDRIGAQPNAYRASAKLRLGQALIARGDFSAALAAVDDSNREWATLRGLDTEDYAYTHLARGRLYANALDPEATLSHLTRFSDLSTKQGLNIAGFRAEVDGERALALCATGRADQGRRLIASAHAALAAGAHDAAEAGSVITEAQARCALSAGDAPTAVSTLDDAARVQTLGTLSPARRLRPQLLRCEALLALDRGAECRTLANAAIAELDALDLAGHPYRARFSALADQASGSAPTAGELR